MHYYPHVDEKQRTLAAIIDVLNDIDHQLQELERISSGTGRIAPFLAQDVAGIIEKFFYNCQIAEERMKNGYSMRYVTQKQVGDLNLQLTNSVRRMRELSEKSAVVSRVLRDKFGAGTAG
ncbi:MAG: hypothetical protein LUQ40_04755 [Methanomicrobiales archaeon]|nr:hypothetical protein [Methanomicrobiales archaeon]